MDQYWTRNEQEQYVKRMEDEHRRQNTRIQNLEDIVKENNKLLISIEKLALNMEDMKKEQREQGQRLEILESRDGQKWREVTRYLMTTGIGLIAGYLFNLVF